MNESEAAFNPDGSELDFSVTASIGTEYIAAIAVTTIANGRWKIPEGATFSDQGLNMSRFVHADGSTLYCVSMRPLVMTLRQRASRLKCWRTYG